MFIYHVMAYIEQDGEQYKGVRYLEIELAEPDEDLAIQWARRLAGTREQFYIQRVVMVDPSLHNPLQQAARPTVVIDEKPRRRLLFGGSSAA